jgi:hypothetical protein
MRYQFLARMFQFGILSPAFQSARSDIAMGRRRRDVDSLTIASGIFVFK